MKRTPHAAEDGPMQIGHYTYPFALTAMHGGTGRPLTAEELALLRLADYADAHATAMFVTRCGCAFERWQDPPQEARA